MTLHGCSHTGVRLNFGKCAASRRRQNRRAAGTRPALDRHRKLGDAWGSAKGCRANLAEAEGLILPSPWKNHLNTTIGHSVGAVGSYLTWKATGASVDGIRRWARNEANCVHEERGQTIGGNIAAGAKGLHYV